MSVKRSRMDSSSSRLDAPVVNANAIDEPPRSKILTFSSPINTDESDQQKVGGFMERCHYCKKRIAPNSDVFMYSNLCAFCSAECRDSQIALDQSAIVDDNPGF